MSISGVPIFIKHFSTAQTLSGTGQILASHAGFFQHVLTAPGVLILSGVKAGWHWLAEIETSATGSEGRVSALQISADTGLKDANMRHVSSGVLSYAPTSSSQSRNADGRKIIQETYKLDMPKYKFLKSTEIWLRDQGWTLASDLPGLQGYSSWRRDSSVLSLFAHSVGDSTLLYVHVVK